METKILFANASLYFLVFTLNEGRKEFSFPNDESLGYFQSSLRDSFFIDMGAIQEYKLELALLSSSENRFSFEGVTMTGLFIRNDETGGLFFLIFQFL